MNLDQVLSKKAGIAIFGMWFISKATLQTAIVLAVVAVIGIVCQTFLDRSKENAT
jgi:hypothetical protein